jgi:hypothetical protein
MQMQLAAATRGWPASATVPLQRERDIKAARMATTVQVDADYLLRINLNRLTDSERAAIFQAKYWRPRGGAATRPIEIVAISGERSRSRSTDGEIEDHRIAVMRSIARLVLSVWQSQDAKVDTLLESMKDAIAFTASLPADLAKPTASASEEGEIFLQWRTSKGRALTTFEGDGSYGYAMQIGGEFVPGSIHISSATEVPQDLAAYLRRLS